MRKAIFIFFAVVFLFQQVFAQPVFDSGKLYTIVPSGSTDKAVGFSEGEGEVKLVALDSKDRLQQWSVSSLSGSLRFINPFADLAIHVRSDNRACLAENNGSDETQLWVVESAGDFVWFLRIILLWSLLYLLTVLWFWKAERMIMHHPIHFLQ